MRIADIRWLVLAWLVAVSSSLSPVQAATVPTYDNGNGRRETLLHFAPVTPQTAAGVPSETAPAQTPAELDVLCPSSLDSALRSSDLELLAVQSEGMNSSLRTWAEIVVAGVTGRPQYRGHHPVAMALSMAYRHAEWMTVPVIPIESPAVAALFGLETNVRHRVSAVSLMKHRAGQRYVMGYLTAGDSALAGLSPEAQKGVKKLAFRVATLLNVPHEFRIVPLGTLEGTMASPFVIEQPDLDPQAAAQLDKASVPNELIAAAVRLHEALRETLASGRPSSELAFALAGFAAQCQRSPDYMPRWKRQLDRWYTTFHPFQRAAQVYWIAVVAFAACIWVMRRTANSAPGQSPGLPPPPSHAEPGGLSPTLRILSGSLPELAPATVPTDSFPGKTRWWYALGVGALVSAALLMASGLVARYFLGGRIPVSNMYESITFTMGSFAVLGVVFETAYRRAWIGLAVALAGTFCMNLANSMPLHLRKVEPLVAVLNSVWLNYHVTALLLSYAAFLLSFLFAIAFFFKRGLSERATFLPSTQVLEMFCYRSVLIGWPLLTLGIFLGAVWANTAWGRYWSWDPKETWAFITWLTYTIYLHLRIVRGWRGSWSVAASMLGFVMVLITYFGVSYLPGLAGGLHSYAQPIAR